MQLGMLPALFFRSKVVPGEQAIQQRKAEGSEPPKTRQQGLITEIKRNNPLLSGKF